MGDPDTSDQESPVEQIDVVSVLKTCALLQFILYFTAALTVKVRPLAFQIKIKSFEAKC